MKTGMKTCATVWTDVCHGWWMEGGGKVLLWLWAVVYLVVDLLCHEMV